MGGAAEGKVIKASNTTLAHNPSKLESVWSEEQERNDSSNTDELQMKPSNADAVTAKHIGAQSPTEWKTRREMKDEAVFRFSNWFKKLGDEDKDKEEEEKEKELAEIVESRFTDKQNFRSLIIEREISAEEWSLMKQFLDYPALAAIVVKMRRSHGVAGLRQDRRRCLTCEESLAGMPLTAHKTEDCSIPVCHVADAGDGTCQNRFHIFKSWEHVRCCGKSESRPDKFLVNTR
ncbi:hypothetical protein L3Y34_002178 [Caenorhabditis briggsae]|uniref:Uncharacterized protein n=1 Tax=Caenorhabditis briggsae TaxID=6238 RepID=A0AAE9DF85_CAEBR|nr:hypothetical protein L3Y34_002178 [Caenorhabditis briggsae]